MNGETGTDDNGMPVDQRIRANVEVGIRQGGIGESERTRWTQLFRRDYEAAVEALASRPVNPAAAASVAASLSPSEAAYRDYAIRTGVIKPWQLGGSYMRSVV